MGLHVDYHWDLHTSPTNETELTLKRFQALGLCPNLSNPWYFFIIWDINIFWWKSIVFSVHFDGVIGKILIRICENYPWTVVYSSPLDRK